MDLKAHVRSVPDFPKPGILFYDIGTLLAHGPAWRETVNQLTTLVGKSKPDVLIGIESRGFIMAAPVASSLGIGMIMARKKGKLPGATTAHSYSLEYGNDTIEMQNGVLKPGQSAIVIDDLLATGGTANAVITLAEKMGAKVKGALFVIELAFLNGREKINVPVESLLSYDE